MKKVNHCKKAYICDGQNDECKFYNTNYFHLDECNHCKDNIYCTNLAAIKELEKKEND